MTRIAVIEAALERACAALADDDVADAERTAKAIAALARAEQDVAAFRAMAPSQEEDEEARRADLRRRIARFVDAERARAAVEDADTGGTEGPAK